MRMPAILQGEARTRFLQGIAFGAVAAMTIGFIWGGWVPEEGTVRTMISGELRGLCGKGKDCAFRMKRP